VFELGDKAAVVIGAASGIGRAIAIGLAGQGASVDCLDLDRAGAEQTAQQIRAAGGKAGADEVDVRSSASVDAALAAVRANRGRVDTVVCTPGINIRKPLLRYTDEDYDAVTDVNLRGTFHVLRAAGRIMAEQRTGSILAISSISCQAVEPGQVIYAGTKAAVAQMVRVLAAELGPFGVRVNALSPGPVETELTAPIRSDGDWAEAYAGKTAMKRWARAAEMAGPAVFLASDAASYVTGEVLFAHGGWTDLDQRFQGGPVFDEVAAP
jgi:NAD(P)-dependent dehydrogenase (short-subunit alcohol dehydrogenase family)